MYEQKLQRAHLTYRDLVKKCDEKYLTFHHLLELKNHLERMGIGLHEREGNTYLLINIESSGLGRKLRFENTEGINIRTAESKLANYKEQQHTTNVDSTLKVQLNILIEALGKAALHKTVITPKQLVQLPKSGFTHHRQIEEPLKLIKTFCEHKKLIPLHLLVINQHTGLPAKMTEVNKQEWEAELNLIYEKIKHQETILLDDEDIREIQEILKLKT